MSVVSNSALRSGLTDVMKALLAAELPKIEGDIWAYLDAKIAAGDILFQKKVLFIPVVTIRWSDIEHVFEDLAGPRPAQP